MLEIAQGPARLPDRPPLSAPVVLAFTSDQHCGSTVALCPPQIHLDDGGFYGASKDQLWLWQCWNDYWQKVQARREALGADLYTVFGGDITDGDHHGTRQILSGNPNAQAAVVNAAMRVVLDLRPDKMLFIRGTEAHVGKSAAHEERIADGLKRDGRPIQPDPRNGTASWWHWKREIQGVRLDITHHGRTGQREHTRGGAAVLHAHDILLSYVKQDKLPPHLCLRAHYHRFNDSYENCPTRVVTSGAFQLKTAYVHRVAADSLADIGGLIVTIQDGHYEVEKVRFPLAEDAAWQSA